MRWTEQEQKFLFHYIPYNEIPFKQKTTIYRKYLSFNPEIRINHRVFYNPDFDDTFHLTIKIDNINGPKYDDRLIRKKIRLDLTESEYEIISHSVSHKELIMDIYDFWLDKNHVIGFKCCKDLDINFAEIEYNDDDDFKKFSPEFMKLPFLSEEVTSNDLYKAKNIWFRLNTWQEMRQND